MNIYVTISNSPTGNHYEETLPFGLTPLLTQQDMREKFGTPTKSISPGKVTVLGEHGGGDYFALPDHPNVLFSAAYSPSPQVKTFNFNLNSTYGDESTL